MFAGFAASMAVDRAVDFCRFKYAVEDARAARRASRLFWLRRRVTGLRWWFRHVRRRPWQPPQ